MASVLGDDDLWCQDDCLSDFRTVSGRTALAQAIYRRWTTDRGTLIGDPNYGTNLTSWLNDDITDAGIGEIIAAACAEAKKDERVVDCKGEADVTLFRNTGVLYLTFEIEDGIGPFALTVSVSDATIELLTAA